MRSSHIASPILVALILLAIPATALLPAGVPPAVPRVVEGFTLTPLVPLAGPTSITFGPGDDLYATTLLGDVVRVNLEWGPAGPIATDTQTIARGFSQPLGLAFDSDGNLFVADSATGAESGRIDGRVSVVEDGEARAVVSGLPNGRHNTNNLRLGPDGRIYIANGNPNDSGKDGDADVFPYSGAILSFDSNTVRASPATLHWRDAGGVRIAAANIATHARNQDFADKISVLGWGFRNVYDVAFDDDGRAYTATNGADAPSSQDLLYRVSPGADHGFPFCYNEGPAGGVGSDVTVTPNPLFGNAARCADTPAATALLGWHVCATGLDVSSGGAFGHAAYIGECGPFYPDDLLARVASEPQGVTHDLGHKFVRVTLDEDGNALEVQDFVSGLALPLDAEFGPDGALYLADVEGVYRVAPLPVVAAASVAKPPVFVVTGPSAQTVGYLTPVVAVQRGGALTLVNADIMRHDVVALGSAGPSDQPWCERFEGYPCPLFWSDLAGLGGQRPVLGLENVAPGATYTYYCTLHHGMKGTLVVLPA